MNAGVSTVPCGVWSRPLRAPVLGQTANNSNRTLAMKEAIVASRLEIQGAFDGLDRFRDFNFDFRFFVRAEFDDVVGLFARLVAFLSPLVGLDGVRGQDVAERSDGIVHAGIGRCVTGVRARALLPPPFSCGSASD